MAERPIIFSGPMVRAILDGRKTQTRRLVRKPAGVDTDAFCSGLERARVQGWSGVMHRGPCDGINWSVRCPYGATGDRLWVRETWAHPILGCEEQGGVTYRADHLDRRGDGPANPIRWRPSIHMPRWASRLTLEVVSVRVQRLQDITEVDARAEGANQRDAALVFADDAEGRAHMQKELNETARGAFVVLWDAINAKRAPWSSNPWVWAIEFKQAEVSNA